MNKLMYKWRELNATFWFVPVAIILISILLSVAFVYLDTFYQFENKGLIRYFIVNSSDSARSILSTISSAMMGVAVTVFSITLVVLQLASSQFGPRLVKNFMHVKLNQVVLGSYVSTYLYCLLVLNAVKDGNHHTFIPSISILVAIIVAVVNIILLIIYIHQVAVSIQADKVISDISATISQKVEMIFPEKIGEEIEKDDQIDAASFKSNYDICLSITAPKSGYLQYIDDDNLMEILSDSDSLLELYCKPGKYLVKDKEIGLLFVNTNWEQDKLDKLLNQFIIGNTKTTQQDFEFSIQQLVEIAGRALSPGINDPFTAISCIDNLTSTLSYLAKSKFPSKYRFNDDGNLKVIAEKLNFEGVLDTSFNQIRQFANGNIAVTNSLMESLILIYEFANNSIHKKAVVKHAEMVLDMSKRSINETKSLENLIEKSKKILAN